VEEVEGKDDEVSNEEMTEKVFGGQESRIAISPGSGSLSPRVGKIGVNSEVLVIIGANLGVNLEWPEKATVSRANTSQSVNGFAIDNGNGHCG